MYTNKNNENQAMNQTKTVTAHDKLVTGMGTRVYRRPDGIVVVVSSAVEYNPGPDERQLLFTRDIVVHFPLANPVTARIEFMTNQDAILYALPEFVYLHPITGRVNQVKKVEFVDGSQWLNPEYIDEQAAQDVQEIIEKFKQCQAAPEPEKAGESSDQ